MIYVFHGDNNFSANEALHELVGLVGTKDIQDANVTSIDGRDFTIDTFGSAAMVAPFISEKRLVIVRDLFMKFEKNQSQNRRKRSNNIEATKAASITNDLYSLLVEMPLTTDVVFLESKTSDSNPMWEMFKKFLPETANGNEKIVIKEFKRLQGQALFEWITRRVRDKGASISQPATNLLAELVGDDLWSMENELEKLSIYKYNQNIETIDIEQITSGARDTNIFELVDSMIEGKTEKSIKLLSTIMGTGVSSTYSSPYLITMLARQVRLIALVHDLSSSGVPSKDWKSSLGTNSDFVVRKTIQQSKALTIHDVKRLYSLLIEADLGIKSSQNSESAILFDLIARASTVGKI